ncbi:MAG: AAA family ATPase [Flavobacteriales bacterium]
MQRIIITGAPCTGKTTILQNLAKMGYSTFDEVAREVIKQELQKGSDVLPWLNLNAFSRAVLPVQIQNHEKAIKGLNFYDRGIPDIAAYQQKSNQAIFEELQNAINKHRYHDKVFITPPWKEIYMNDSERKESFEEAMEIHDFLVKVYTNNSYELIEIPKVNLEERLKFIIESVK